MKPSRPVECTAVVLESRPLTSDVSTLVLRLMQPERLPFKAGQFINLTIPSAEGRVIRAYSIASSPADPTTLRFYFDHEVPGPGVSYVKGLQPGTEVRFKGPLGLFTLKPPLDVPLWIVSHISAVGMALQVARAALEETPGRCVTFICEPKQPRELWFGLELLELAAAHGGFRHVITVPGGAPGWEGPTRTLEEELLRRVRDPLHAQVYVCGLGSMVTALKEALKARGMPASAIVSEKWSKGEEEEG